MFLLKERRLLIKRLKLKYKRKNKEKISKKTFLLLRFKSRSRKLLEN